MPQNSRVGRPGTPGDAKYVRIRSPSARRVESIRFCISHSGIISCNVNSIPADYRRDHKNHKMSTPSNDTGSKASTSAAKPRKRFVGTKSSKPSKPGVQSSINSQIPPDILNDVKLNAAIQQIPPNYSFEIHKTIHHVRKNNATMVALQMPEGLQMFACTIADIIERCALDFRHGCKC